MNTEAIFITGASSDLAMGLIRSLMKTSHPPRVLAHFHQGARRIDELKAEFPSLICPLQADLASAPEVEHLISEVRREAGFPRKIICFAGLKLRLERFHEANLSRFTCDFSVQVFALMRLLREFLPAMAQSQTRTKVVLMLSSVTLGIPPKFMSFYTVIKHAQFGLLRALASEYAGTSININAISPYMVETQFLSEIPEKARELAAAQSPLHRLVTPHEVVEVIEFLLSPASDCLNGVNIPVTGGTAY
jgi:3-oxoacyl-[acyl-carrier protein] reductase